VPDGLQVKFGDDLSHDKLPKDMAMKGTNAHALVLATLLGFSNSTAACPLARLARIANEPIASLRHKELPLTHWESTAGGRWDIYLRSDGTLHSIIRTDFGETGQRKTRASFLTKDDFVVVSTTVRYRSPVRIEYPVKIASTISTPYFFCENAIYIPAIMDDESSATQSLIEAKRLKSDIFESGDLASYLKRIK
jgi:hypothetical protein